MTTTKENVFKEIVDIMSKDYSGCNDKKVHNHPEKYEITDQMDDEDFVKTVQSYLMDFQDYHIHFIQKSSKAFSIGRITLRNGFSVRRYEDKLYVTETIQEKELIIGDTIISIDNMDIAAMAGLHRKELFDDVYERQNWNNVLNNVKNCTVQRHGMEFEFTIKQYSPVAVPPVYSFEKVNNEVCLLTLSDFADESSINSLLNKNHETIINSSYLIIDVRNNGGGFDMAFYQLLSYISPQKIMFSDLLTDDDTMFFNCTERNCDLRKETFEDILKGELGDNISRFIEKELLYLKENYGKGFVIRHEMDSEIKGRATPANIFILTDCYCRSSGDEFVKISKNSSKVKVIGRNTLGITDYSNGVFKDYGELRLSYPISKTTGNHINGIGVTVDLYIPWTPEHLVKDVDLERVLSMV